MNDTTDQPWPSRYRLVQMLSQRMDAARLLFMAGSPLAAEVQLDAECFSHTHKVTPQELKFFQASQRNDEVERSLFDKLTRDLGETNTQGEDV